MLPGIFDDVVGGALRQLLWGNLPPASTSEAMRMLQMPSGLPTAVRESILRGPSYGEGEVMPSRDTRYYPYTNEPAFSTEREDSLVGELGLLEMLRRDNAPRPSDEHPFGPGYYTKPAHPMYAPPLNLPGTTRLPLALY